MTDTNQNGAPKPGTDRTGQVHKLPYDGIGDQFPGQIEISNNASRPVPIQIVHRPLAWLWRVSVNALSYFLGGAAGAVFVQWLMKQPGFWRFVERLQVWP